jgi:hypothetical protein
MKRATLLIGLCAMIAFCASSVGRAATISVSIDGVSQSVPNYFVPDEDGDGGVYHIGTPDGADFTWATSRGRITLGGELNPDPSLNFAAGVTDMGASSLFSFSFVLPLAPLVSNPSFVFDSLSGSVTNGAAAGGVTVTAVAPPPIIPLDGDGIDEIQVFSLSDDGGLTWKNVGLDAGPTTFVPLGSNNSGSYGAYNQGFIPTIAGGPWTHMRADVNFRLSGGNDTFAFTGVKVITPEPGTFVLALLSIAALVCARRSLR